MPIPAELINLINEITSEIYKELDHAAAARPRGEGNLAILLTCYTEEIVKMARNVAHEAIIDEDDSIE